MSARPIFVATHPRSCSTAFERVFMTRSADIVCAHEPFGDAFYYGPERLGSRFAHDAESRERSGFAYVTYKDVIDRLEGDSKGDKRLFIKDMSYYLMPPDGKPASVAPSLAARSGDSQEEQGNPTVLPLSVLREYQFAFLIRHPRYAIPSYYRCTQPPLVEATLFHDFLPCESGYGELRHMFDYLRAKGLVGEEGEAPAEGRAPVVVIDADDLLDRPTECIKTFCDKVGLAFTPEMLQWEGEENQQKATGAFEKWKGFHNDALLSSGLKARTSHRVPLTDEEEDEQWRQKYGEKGQKIIRHCVSANLADYEYLKSFSLKF